MPKYHTLPSFTDVVDAAVSALTSDLAFKVYRTFIVSFVAVWAVSGYALSKPALTAAVAAAGTAVLNGYVVPAWRKYKAE